MEGRIIKGIAGFYYVYVPRDGTYECKAKGIFRKENKKPLVGDEVQICILDEKDREGSIQEIMPRKNQLARPAVANVDQAVLIFAVDDPRPNYTLLDRFLVMMEKEQIPVCLCFNKKDLGKQEDIEAIRENYASSGYPVVFTSVQTGDGVGELDELLEGKTTVVAGPSGVGKSSLANSLQREIQMETGVVSRKLKKGRHTTRHSQLIPVREGTYLMDTPGFSSLYLEGIEEEELRFYFPEFEPYEGQCRFQGCTHTSEPDCMVIQALQEKRISSLRYKSYLALFSELRDKRRY
ncbi:MAG: ribosome small subunit-dependent GTPase A [Lachnospiraceae bacterium]|nr:ribosome small subunit-dependent GTPase A [Lachnospiraceae bacterium]